MNKRRYMKPIKLLLLSITMFINTTLAQQNSETKSTISANNTSLVLPQIQIVPIQDSKTERSYELYIKLPKGYLENVPEIPMHSLKSSCRQKY